MGATTTSPFVIAGAGLAGAKAAEALRDGGSDRPVVLAGDEQERPYERPPLSKEYLRGMSARDEVYVHPRGWYEENGVELRLAAPVAGIDPGGHTVTLGDGETLPYAKLLLATGSSPRRLPVPGENLDGVHYLRRLAESDALKETLGAASRLVVIGGGWIGLEVTAAAREAGVRVTLLEAADLPLVGVLGRETAQVFADLHTDHGVDVRCGTHVTEITGEAGRVSGVLLPGGERIAADAVVVAVGVSPNTALADGAGIETDDGVRVDAALRTSHPDIWAAGDVARAFHPLLGRHIRVEHWANALNQPATAARSMLGEDASYDRLPYFFTDQYDLGMEYTGHVGRGGYDRVVFRGSPADRQFIAFWLRERRVLAGMNVNVWDVTGPIRTLVTSGLPVDAGRLGDVGVPLTEVFAGG
ncbi:pyridine nucleotide-disulfide oxidoreductase [Streptomyces abyssalis]|uniref:Pyridine nucleotide-disulfide oxidoreductase n=1 Tax=Streptomyces abyssalis TaxID=933944 RepID=A0A1E7JU01_9ACTN|nr:FAD/NAD(P)-binding oxidoreductase [Streptomyces abyssalis]OEU88895.1 pyridine nucleotide-disulfide oxidoreductase [Streptomyces abyssalis]OEU93446.1 pyridine nucleotide-disulfide oxidoreductase [Streptomyces abyssalis]